jgi:small subunit ribosomal protein S7
MFLKTNQNLKNNDSTLFFSFLFKKIISRLMQDGKKFKAEIILKKVLIRISLQNYSPVNVLILATNNTKPLLEVRNVRIKGKAFQVPFPILLSRQITSSFRILLSSFDGKKKFEDFLVEEWINSSVGKSQSVKATVSLHKLASQNRLFARFRWF